MVVVEGVVIIDLFDFGGLVLLCNVGLLVYIVIEFFGY